MMSNKSTINICRENDDDCKRNDYTWFFKEVNGIINNSKNVRCYPHSSGQNMCDMIVCIYGQIKQGLCLLIECHKPEHYDVSEIRKIKSYIDYASSDIKRILYRLERRFYENKSTSMDNCQSKLNHPSNSLYRFFVPPNNYSEYRDLLNTLLNTLL